MERLWMNNDALVAASRCGAESALKSYQQEVKTMVHTYVQAEGSQPN